jgi:hypothetical protein
MMEINKQKQEPPEEEEEEEPKIISADKYELIKSDSIFGNMGF